MAGAEEVFGTNKIRLRVQALATAYCLERKVATLFYSE